MAIERKAVLRRGARPRLVCAPAACAWALFASALLAPPAVYAQSAGSSAADEIVVTARGRAEVLRDVPIQITAFTGNDITDAGIATTGDFADLTPNMSFDDAFTYLNSFVVMRGLSQINNADPPVAVVVDGVPQSNQRQLKLALFDIDGVEVLRGPQGAYYGRNAVGGAVNIRTREPSETYEGSVSARYASGGAVDVSGAAGGPLLQGKALFRVAGTYKEDGGRIENTFLGRKADFIDHDYALRSRLALFPVERVRIDLCAAYSDFSAGTLYDAFVPSGDANDHRTPSANLPGTAIGDIFDASAKIETDVGFATLSNSLAFTQLAEGVRGDVDFSNAIENPGGAFGLGPAGQGSDLDLRLFSEELRLVSPDHGRFRWLAGFYYLHTDRRLHARLFTDLDGSPDQIDDQDLVFFRQFENDNNNSWSLYAQGDLDLTDRLTATVALRYDGDRRRQRDLLTGLSRTTSFRAFQPKLSLSYGVGEQATFYASYAEGFRSGGFNAPGAAPFRAETVRNLEVGFKTRAAKGRVQLKGAYYHAFVDDFQFFFLDLDEGGQVISNLDKVTIHGVEFETRALAGEGVEFFASIGTTRSRIDRSADFPAIAGNRTPRTTGLSVNLGAEFRRQLFRDVSLFARVDYERRGKKFWHIDNLDVQMPLDLLNLRAGLEFGDVGVYAFGRNVTGETYYADYNPDVFTGLGYDIGFPAQRARFGVEARARF